MKIYFVILKYKHHLEFSGYDQLIKYIPYRKIFSQNILEKKTLISRILKSFIFHFFGNYHNLLEYKIRLKLFNKSAIVHYIYPYNHYRNFGRFKGKNKIIATLHQTIDFYENLFEDTFILESYKEIDRFIVLSKSLKYYIDNKMRKKNTVFIPHGVDTLFFKPGFIKRRLNSILMVGNWLRDFSFARSVFQSIYKLNKNINITIISKVEDKKHFWDLDYVEFKSNISSLELRKEYQINSILFLPLINCTANNALLEGLACGIPICVSRVKNVFDYVDEDKVITFNHDIVECRDLLLNTLKDKSLLEELSNHSFAMSKNYDWNLIAEKTISVYKEL